MAASFPVTPEQGARERSILFALLADTVIGIPLVVVGVVGGSLTILAECIRGWLMWAIELFSLLVMRRIHRGVLADMEFGVGKLEQIANLSIAAGMLVGAAWIVVGAVEIVAGAREAASPLGLAMAAIIASVNTCINIVAWDGMRRAARRGRSVIMQAQLKSRAVRVLSSVFVQAMLTMAAVTRDSVAANWADAVGSVFVAGLIAVNAFQMFRSGLPDLLDRTVEEEVQIAINRALALHFEDYDRLDRVRSRRAGHVVFVEVALGFDARLTVSEVGRRIEALRATMQGEIANGDISILASSHVA